MELGGGFFFHPGDIDNIGDTHRVNNAIKWTKVGASFMTTALFSLGGKAGQFSQNQIWSLGANYSSNSLSLAAAYLNVRNPNTSFFTDSTTLNSSLTNFSNRPVFAGYASARTYQVAGAAARYAWGQAVFNVVYTNIKFSGLGDLGSGPNALGYSGSAVFNNVEVGATYRITPALLAGLAYNYTHNGGASGRGSAIYNEVMGGVDYLLSKRTDVYAGVIWAQARGTDSLGEPAVAQASVSAASGRSRQTDARIAMRHRF
ncbi:porin [Paraburkholderia dipogonis]|uniref:porin n=1 Tax=Paraburkholderia dipogonis TaxID=1211383 RepID=UPI0038B86435